MNQLPPSAIHAYIRHYNLVPLPLPLPQSVPTVPAPINYTQAVYPTGPVSASVLQPEQDQPPEAKDGLDTLKTPAWDGQEIGEADHRLVELARNHWDNVQLKEGSLIA